MVQFLYLTHIFSVMVSSQTTELVGLFFQVFQSSKNLPIAGSSAAKLQPESELIF